MRRREFIALAGSMAGAWPRIARAQQGERVRLVCLLEGISADTPAAKAREMAFFERLQQLGWMPGRDLRIEIRWAGGDQAKAHKQAAELIALAPDVIVAPGSLGAEVMLKATHTIPIVFVITPDPVGSGYVESLSRPGGNATGFMMFEYNLCGKWLELLKEIAPTVTHAAVLRDPNNAAGVGQFAVIQSVAPSVGIEVSAININDLSEIEDAVSEFAGEPNGGLIITAASMAFANREMIIKLAARHKLPAVYSVRDYVIIGGLISYGSNLIDQFQRSASYVDRILKGEKPADLPVQAPTKYELAVNLNTAKALGLSVPPAVLARADEVIE